MNRLWAPALVVLLAVALAFLVLPVVAIFADVGPGELLRSLDDPAARDALELSLVVTVIALAVIVLVGTPVAWLLATRRFPGRRAVEVLIELPLVLPPAVAGVGLLDALELSLVVTVIALAVIVLAGTPVAWLLATRRFPGRRAVEVLIELPLVLPPAVAGVGLLAALGPEGILGGAAPDLVFTTAGVVVALVFVASPFYLRQAQAAFAALDPDLLAASRTLGAAEAATFARVALPLARPSLVSGAALAWGRALGEFGATLIFAGSFRGVTRTAPLEIFARLSNDFTGALALSAVLVAVSAALLLGVKWVGRT